jgi:hypothetical protein
MPPLHSSFGADARGPRDGSVAFSSTGGGALFALLFYSVISLRQYSNRCIALLVNASQRQCESRMRREVGTKTDQRGAADVLNIGAGSRTLLKTSFVSNL